MTNTDLLNNNTHRPWPAPSTPWKYYQEWNNALFLHWKVPVDAIRTAVPEGLTIDTFEGFAYISLVAFTMQKIRPRYLPSLAFISDFEEINLRTYIDIDGKKGVYFISIEAGKSLSALLSRTISVLPYRKSVINRSRNSHVSTHASKDFSLSASFEILETVDHKTELEKWLTERYCLYADKQARLYRYEVHHPEWELKNVHINKLDLKYAAGTLNLEGVTPDYVHYSEGVQVLAWDKELLFI